MSDTPDRPPEPSTGALQFDRAVPASGEPAEKTCAGCKNPVGESYYTANQAELCPSCTEGLRAELAADSNLGAGKFVRAFLYGAGAALLGTMGYFAILAISGYEIGWIAVGVGWLVGKAVCTGAGGARGRKLQWMAVGLTYLSIVFSYVPLSVKGMMDKQQEAADAKGKDGGKSKSLAPRPQAQPHAVQPPATPQQPATPGNFLIGSAVLFGVILAMPFLAGLENILGILIIAIGLFEAWRQTRPVAVVFSGPFQTGPAPE